MSTFLRQYFSNAKAAVSLALFTLLSSAGFLAPLFHRLDRTADAGKRYQPPSFQHWLGTDYAGRDILEQLLMGTGDMVTVSLLTGLLTVLFAVLVGTLSAYFEGRWLGSFLLGLTDVFLTVPNFPVMAIAAALLSIDNVFQFALVLSVWAWPDLARGIRARVLSCATEGYVEGAELQAMGVRHVLVREIFPNLIPFILVHFVKLSRDAVAISVGIMLLGLVPLRVENWGMMLNMATVQSGAIYIPKALHFLLAPLVAIVFYQYLLVNISQGLEEANDPRLGGIS